MCAAVLKTNIRRIQRGQQIQVCNKKYLRQLDPMLKKDMQTDFEARTYLKEQMFVFFEI